MNTRREFLTKLGVGALVATGAAAVAACGKGGGAAAACTDPSGATNPTRTALHYTDTSPKPDQKCDGCAQFTAGTECGKCKIFSDSPVSPGGWCDSWAKKA